MSLQIEDYMGAVPVIISLSETDCTVQGKPAPLTYVLPRSSVLLSVRTEVQNFFSPFTVTKDDATPLVWLTCRGEPIPWQYPVGSIKDCISALAISDLNKTPVEFVSKNETRSSPAELYPTVFASPLALEVRITCVAGDKPLTIPCPGQEDYDPHRSGDKAIDGYLKQVIKGTFSAMYGSIKVLMDARTEVINDMLRFATCTSTGEKFMQVLRAHNDRIAGLRRVAGTPKNLVVMINIPFSKNPFHFSLFRVPLNIGGNNDSSLGEPKVKNSINDKNNEVNNVSDDKLCEGETRSEIRQSLEMPFGELMWRALLEPYLKWKKKLNNSDIDTLNSNSLLFHAISPFYNGIEDNNISLSDVVSSGVTESLVKNFITAGDATTFEESIRVKLPMNPPQECRLCFMLQGLQPPLETPVGFLLERFTSADSRLYVTLTYL